MTKAAGLAVELRDRLHSAVLSDVLDAMGYRDQVLDPAIRPLDERLVLIGRARTALYMEVFHIEPGENPYELEMALIDDLRPGDVAVLCCAGSRRITPWGELLSTAATARGAGGCLTDGMIRDTRVIREMKFPIFHAGRKPTDAQGRGKVVAIDVPVVCGGVRIRTGDLIFGDADGVVVVPAEAVDEAVTRALAKIDLETTAREELSAGALLRDVFKRHNVL
jgi:4-hydroxy-4-methyl-2-oxoglutarate aldolase